MKVTSTTVKFRIDIDFDDADVDMVYNEVRARGGFHISPVPSLIVDFEAKGGFGRKSKKFKLKGDKTPTEATVDFALNWLAGFVDRRNMCTTTSKWDTDLGADWVTVKNKDGFEYATKPTVKTELEEIGVSVESWYGLMMGTCHLVCEVDATKYNKKLVQKATTIVQDIFKRFVKYYKHKKAA